MDFRNDNSATSSWLMDVFLVEEFTKTKQRPARQKQEPPNKREGSNPIQASEIPANPIPATDPISMMMSAVEFA